MSSDTTIQFTVQATPAQVFTTIVDVRAWWSGDIHGPTDQLGGEFTPEEDHRTHLRFTHRGLAPDLECSQACSGAWQYYIGTSSARRSSAGPTMT